MEHARRLGAIVKWEMVISTSSCGSLAINDGPAVDPSEVVVLQRVTTRFWLWFGTEVSPLLLS